MNELIQIIGMDWRNGLISIAAIIIIFVWVIQKTEYICEKFGIQTKAARREEKQDKDIQELKGHAQKTDQNIDKLLGNIECLQNSIHEVSNQVDALQKKVNDNEISKLSDRITQSYRYYKTKKQWTTMEKWAFENLCRSYKNAGGDSFIDEIAIPRSKEWEVVDE